MNNVYSPDCKQFFFYSSISFASTCLDDLTKNTLRYSGFDLIEPKIKLKIAGFLILYMLTQSKHMI